MLEPRLRWRIPDPIVVPEPIVAAAADLGLPPLAAEVLARRGLSADEELRAFLGADGASGFHDPGLLPDAGPTVRRLARARDLREPVMVVGDFDADGLTGLAILARVLRACGLTVGTHIPDRADEGHGLSLQAIAAAEAAGARVIVTVDTGTSSIAEVAEAGRRGIDTIVTDHHRVGPELPPAVAVVNPHRPDATYPDTRLAGSGVALKVAQLVARELLDIDPERTGARLADLAAIGTVADVAPLLGENRTIARLGLARLRTHARPGIAALFERAGVDPSTVDIETIAYTIAPRLNAAGRVGEARQAADLLLTEDAADAAALADALEQANATRREVMRGALEDARSAVAGDRPIVMIVGDWPIGIIGLLAGRLADESGKPAIVGRPTGDTIRASARAGGAIDLAATLDAASDLLLRHGGHRQAAGFEVDEGRWEALRERIEHIVAAVPRSDDHGELAIDLALASPSVDHHLLRALGSLEPTGPGNPIPTIAIEGLTVVRARAVNGGHTQVTLRRDPDVLDAIAFGRDDLATALVEEDRIDVVAHLGSRRFAGLDSMQLELLDAATTGGHAASPALRAAIAAREPLAAAR